MKNYLQAFRLLNNNELLSLYDLTPEVLDELRGNWMEKTTEGFAYFQLTDGAVVMKDHIDKNEGAILYPNIKAFLKAVTIGIKSATIFHSFQPDGDEFLKNIPNHIAALAKDLHLDESKLNYSGESLGYIERELHKRVFKRRQHIERYYLGILAYAGESLCRHYSANWFIKKEQNHPNSSWSPYVKLPDGRVLDAFVYLHEGLLLWGETGFIPTITIIADSESARPAPDANSLTNRRIPFYYWHEGSDPSEGGDV